LIVISGPSGVGKTSLCEKLLEREEFVRVITCTTRPPRDGETNGEDYIFLDREEFEAGIDQGRFLEYANVYGKYYGSPRDQVEAGIEAGQSVLLNIDVQGAQAIRESGIPELTTVFIAPPSFEELEKRLRSRSTDSEEVIRGRLEVARKELEEQDLYDHVVVNDQFDAAVVELEELLLASH